MSVETNIHVPDRVTPAKVGFIIDNAIIEFGLIVTMRGTLKSFPGSTHWHIKRGRERGTLEVTWWPRRRRLWIKVQAGRTAPWMDDLVPRFKRKVESHLRRLARSARNRQSPAPR